MCRSHLTTWTWQVLAFCLKWRARPPCRSAACRMKMLGDRLPVTLWGFSLPPFCAACLSGNSPPPPRAGQGNRRGSRSRGGGPASTPGVGHPKTGRAPFLGCLGCLSRLFVRAGTGRKRYNVLGALNAVTHEVIRVGNEGYVTADTVCALLRTLPASGLRVPVTVVLDNARCQRCEPVQSLAKQLGIHLLFLPSYSANLNLIERLWRFVRKQSLNSTWFDAFGQFQAAIDDCLNKMTTAHKQEAATLFVHQFQRFEDVPILAA